MSKYRVVFFCVLLIVCFLSTSVISNGTDSITNEDAIFGDLDIYTPEADLNDSSPESYRADLINYYLSDDEMRREFEQNPTSFYDNIDRIVAWKFDLNNRRICNYRSSTYAYITPHPIQQYTYYYCGPASALISLYGMGRAGYISGTTDVQKQCQLASDMETDTHHETYLGDLVDALNLYSGSSGYTAINRGIMSYIDCADVILDSINNGTIPILRAMTGSLSYYGGHNTGHYLTVYYIDQSDGVLNYECGLFDPHSSNSYYGYHSSVPYNEVWNAIGPDRHIICEP